MTTPAPNPIPPQLLTCEQVADVCQVPIVTVRQWSKRGGGPRFLKVGRHLRVRPEDLAAFLDSCAKTADQPKRRRGGSAS